MIFTYMVHNNIIKLRWEQVMIDIKCETANTLKIGQLKPFQDDLKKRSEKNIEDLACSILNDGLLMPFVVWRHDDINSLLDGHGRLSALNDLLYFDNDIATQDFPVLYIDADTEDDAKKILLQITSVYGKINKQGAIKFCSTIPEYHAPSIDKYVHRKAVTRKKKIYDGEQVLRIAVANDKADAVRELFKTIDYIRVL